VANDDQVRHSVECVLANFKSDLLVSQVREGTKTLIQESFRDLSTIFRLSTGNIEYCHLFWRQPKWERSLIVLNQNTDKALKGTQDRPVQHHRRAATLIVRHILGSQTSRHGEVYLDGTTLPDPTETILQGKLNLGSVEGTLTGQFLPRQLLGLQGLGQGLLGLVPSFVRTHPFFGTGRQFIDNLGEAEICIDLMQEVDKGCHL